MKIPQLRLNVSTGAVSTLAGEGVAIFIDYMPATREDLEGMNTQDVKRIEIYDYPSDIRFQNKPHVINYIVQKYEWGGYTLLCIFSDGVRKKVDMSPLLDKPMFAELADKEKFQQFGLDGTLFWSNGADIAPEYLYDRGMAV